MNHRFTDIVRNDLVSWVLGDESNTLLNVLLQVGQAGVEELLLLGVNLANLVDLGNTLWAELDLGGEEVNTLVLVEWGVDKGWLDDTGLTLGSLEEGLGETSTSHGHGEGGGSSSILGLDDLITTELDAFQESRVPDEIGVLGLGEEWDDSDTRVSTDNGDGLLSWVGLLELGNEAGSADDIEGGDTKELLWVVDTSVLEDLGNNWDGGVDWVGNDQDGGVWSGLSNGLGEVADDGSVGVEKIITFHAWLTWNTGWDENDLGILKGRAEAGWGWLVTGDGRLGVDVGDISRNTCAMISRVYADSMDERKLTWSSTDVVESELSDAWVELEEKGQWLSDSTSGTENGDLGEL